MEQSPSPSETGDLVLCLFARHKTPPSPPAVHHNSLHWPDLHSGCLRDTPEKWNSSPPPPPPREILLVVDFRLHPNFSPTSLKFYTTNPGRTYRLWSVEEGYKEPDECSSIRNTNAVPTQCENIPGFHRVHPWIWNRRTNSSESMKTSSKNCRAHPSDPFSVLRATLHLSSTNWKHEKEQHLRLQHPNSFTANRQDSL